ncbi:hypothetical protein PACILC2_12690 [Paenibacillus cisolokensis]|uniref:Uncharacterized protein n=1 Tax=Paenibacillus cisolokensis TaxID=1658519 RepID=A0ABQ4N420_9BACL|nr:hypothetical protein PACILC2_12690 [Paenibacillus cisolokensis]
MEKKAPITSEINIGRRLTLPKSFACGLAVAVAVFKMVHPPLMMAFIYLRHLLSYQY